VVVRESPSVSDEALLDLCRERLARFKIPRHVIRIAAEDIPVTPSGRARKFLLSEIAVKRLGLPISHDV
jgi:fatty-acyl-CoA synthase